MTVLEGFMPSLSFKEECGDGMGLDLIVPQRRLNKQRRAEFGNKPIDSHEYFVAMFLNEDGSLQMKSSGQMHRYERYILQEARHKFRDTLENWIEPPQSKRRRLVNYSPLSAVPRAPSFHPYERKPVKRRYPLERVEQPPVLSSQRKEPPRQPPRGDRTVAIRIDDVEAQKKWFNDAFKAVQQVACRIIAKVWIKKIHPKKQSTHPYNGQFPRNTQADPSRTKPPYWPEKVFHKEPDHIDRSARTELLVHLIMNTPQLQIKQPQDSEVLIGARDLWNALEEKKLEFKVGKLQIIAEIIDVREQIETFENGGYDPETVLLVPDFSESSRSSKPTTDAETNEGDTEMAEAVSSGIKEEEDDDDDDVETPPSTRAPSPLSDRATDASQSNCMGQDPLATPQEPGDRAMAQDTESFDPSAEELEVIPSEQDSIGMTVDPRSFVRDQKPGPSQVHLQRYLAHNPMAFRPQAAHRQGHDLMLHTWLPSEAPNDFIQTGFGLDGGQMLSPNGFPVDELGLMHSNRQAMSMHPAQGLPMTEGITYQDFTTSAPRPLPLRTMSTPHGAMTDQAGVHGLGLGHPSYFIG